MVFNDGPKRHDCGCSTCRRLGLEVDALEARLAKYEHEKVGYHGPHPEGTCLVCESQRAEEEALDRLEKVVEVLQAWRCKVPSPLWDAALAAAQSKGESGRAYGEGVARQVEQQLDRMEASMRPKGGRRG